MVTRCCVQIWNPKSCFQWNMFLLVMCFGSVADFTAAQHTEIAMALEKSGQEFIWVVKKGKQRQGDGEEAWLPEGYEQRPEGKGLIIRGWAPQVMILEHESVGGFVTHCGWNSTLEAITAGVPMVKWPVSAEQFYNEKLVTEVLKIGVGVGTKQWAMIYGDGVKKEAIERAVARVMAGEEAEEMRSRTRNFGEMARRAVEEGGSSHSDANAFIEELRGKGMQLIWQKKYEHSCVYCERVCGCLNSNVSIGHRPAMKTCS